MTNQHPLTDEIKPGDYVLAADSSDFDPNNLWCIGFVNHITLYKRGLRYYVCGEDGYLLGWGRGWKHVKRITPEEGAIFIEENQ